MANPVIFHNSKEFSGLLKKIPENSKWILEIGTYRGFSSCRFSNYAEKVITVDIVEHEFDFCQPNNIIRIIGDSTNKETISKIETILDGDMIDFLFIDGKHDYNTVKKDWENYHSFVRSGGVVAFHDIVRSKFHDLKKCEIWKFWNEISSQYEHQTIIKDGVKYGVGILTI